MNMPARAPSKSTPRLATLLSLAALASLPVSASERPSVKAAILDSLARAWTQAAETYQGSRVLSASAPYLSSLKAYDSIVDTSVSLAWTLARQAKSLDDLLSGISQGDRARANADAASLESEIYDKAMRLKLPIGNLMAKVNGPTAESDSAFACCPGLPYHAPELAPLRILSAAAGNINAALENEIDPKRIAEEIRRDDAILKKFNLKLLEGFPAYPWEYLFNLTGDRRHPASGQLIWLHPTFGFIYSGGWDSAPVNALMLEEFVPSMQVELIGFNHYFFNKKFNYLGASAVFWTGINRDERGFAVTTHLANWATIGMSFSTARDVTFPVFHPSKWDADWRSEPRLMIGWTTATRNVLEVFKKL